MKITYCKYKNKEGSALMIVILLFFTIFVMSFSSGYLVFLNIFKSLDTSNNIRAHQAALSGVERAQFEVINNDFDFASSCSSDIFFEEINERVGYSIDCINNNGDLEFYSTGHYEESQVVLKINCINIEEYCLSSCRRGSLCDGKKLLDTNLDVCP